MPAQECRRDREAIMFGRGSIGAMALAAALALPMTGAAAFDESKYPDFSGQWRRPPGIGIQWDQTKPLGRGQQAPLTPEYQKAFEASMADQAAGGQGNDPPSRCAPFGMPRIMSVIFPMEIVITPKTTHIIFDYALPRRIYTDGRSWPAEIEPSHFGYSIGTWVDDNGDGRYDALEIETRGFKGPRTFEATGIPLADDNETVIKERIFIDKGDPDILHDVITVVDHALTRPWVVDKRYKRDHNPIWFQNNCSEDNRHVFIGSEHYVLSGDDLLMPSKKNQAPPDLRYFKKTQK
jgi:hypothetical protein